MEQLFTVTTIAERLSVHPKTIWRWVREGRFPQPIYIAPRLPRWRANAGLIPNARNVRLPATVGYQEVPRK